MARPINTSIVLNGRDNLSPVVSRAVHSSVSSLETLGKKAARVSTGAFAVGRGAAYTGTALAAPLIYAGKKAIDFEEAMADVAKVANVQIGGTEFKALGQEAKVLGEYLGTGAVEASQLFAKLSSGGVAKEQLSSIGKQAGEVGVAFGLMSGDAGEKMIKMQNQLGITAQETKNTADAINYLSDDTISEAPDILNFLSSGGAGVGRAFKLSGAETAAFGASLVGLLKSAEEGATVLERFSKTITENDKINNIYNKGGGGAKGFQAVLSYGANLPEKDRKQAKFFQEFGMYGNQISLLAKTMTQKDGLNDALNMVAKTENYAGSVHKEFANRQSTTLGGLKKDWAGFGNTVIDVGEQTTPVLRDILNDIRPITKSTGEWVAENPKLTKSLVETTAGIVATSFAISGLAFVIGNGAKAVAGATVALKWLSSTALIQGAIDVVAYTNVFSALGTTALAIAAPFAGAALAITGVGLALVVAYNKVEPFHNAMTRLFTGVQSFTDHIGPALGAIMAGDWDRLARINDAANQQADINAGIEAKDFHASRAGDVADNTNINAGLTKNAGRNANAALSPFSPVGGYGTTITQVITVNGSGFQPADKRNWEKMAADSKRGLMQALDERDRKKERISF